ncbi:MAG: ornithine cyclodeaminase family protein [Oscillospiraceae bacterium]|jgi:alanine dehydrogenase|nr:ornithine cyclodeaminase family protein [Oscillospiraceae bacterium]
MQVIILGRRDLERVLDLPGVIEGVREAYRLKAAGETAVWPLVAHHFEERKAVMDIRSGAVFGAEQIHGLKMLNNFPGNRERGLPPFNGMLMVFDSRTGLPLGVMDAAYITCMRTGAAGAVAAAALARPEADTLTVLGAGKQAIFQIAAALTALPGLRRIFVADQLDKNNERAFAAACPDRLREGFGIEREGVAIQPAGDLGEAVGQSGVVITITPSRAPVIRREWVRPGTHFSCIGADMEGKEELDPELFRDARVFADDIGQCLRVGELELPVKQGIITREQVAGEIGQVLAGTLPGRTDPEQTTIFDATGLALLDLVTGKRAIEAAARAGKGLTADI